MLKHDLKRFKNRSLDSVSPCFKWYNSSRALCRVRQESDLLSMIETPIKELKMGVSGIDNKSDSRLTLHKTLGELYHLKQGETDSNDRFLERFKSCVNMVELSQGKSIFCVKSFADALDKNDMTLEEIAVEEQCSKAVLLLECSDPKRYGNLFTRLQETTSLGRNDYPRTVSSMFEVMMKQKQQRIGAINL